MVANATLLEISCRGSIIMEMTESKLMFRLTVHILICFSYSYFFRTELTLLLSILFTGGFYVYAINIKIS